MNSVIKNVARQIPVLTKILHAYRLAKYKQHPIPWSVGYAEFKWQLIEKLLTIGSMPSEPFGQGIDERVVEYLWAMKLLPKSNSRIWDAGSAMNFPQLLGRLKDNSLYITTLFPEWHCQYYDGISYTYEDLRGVSFRGDFFDYIVSISTIEHIGFNNRRYCKWESKACDNKEGDYIDVLMEFKRVLKAGGVLLISVPFGKHQVYDNFQVFDCSMVKQMARLFTPGSFNFEVYKYTPSGWIMVDPQECSETEYCLFDKIPASDGAAGARAVALIKLIKA